VKPKILAVIPARGGSKGVPKKNIREVCGKPLIAYTIEAALAASGYLEHIIVTTDDPETAEISRSFGADVPFMRPAELSGDKAPTGPVLQHAVSFMEQKHGIVYDWVLLLQPTAPFREPNDFKELVEIAQSRDCDSIISVVQVFAVHPILMKKIEDGYLTHFCIEEKEGTRRQDYNPAAYMRNGVYYMTRRNVLMNKDSIWGEKIMPYVMPENRSVGIDSELDLKMVEILMEERMHPNKA
jgi:CMP-N-acetylneuraminic acid synthetase